MGECTDKVQTIVKDVFEVAVAIAGAVIGQVDIQKIIEDLGAVALDLADGVCSQPKNPLKIF